jgi:hypothetical protein
MIQGFSDCENILALLLATADIQRLIETEYDYKLGVHLYNTTRKAFYVPWPTLHFRHLDNNGKSFKSNVK